MAYSKTNWQNEPSHATPLSADNLNKIENELYTQSINLVVDNSVSLGRKSATTVGTNSSTLGSNCTASGSYSHAEGYSTTASEFSSHAEGNNTRASGDEAHAEGFTTTASGNYSHAEGLTTTASGRSSHAQNYGTIANGDNQTTLGTYNIADTTSLVIVGNGADSSNRSNALTVDGSGNVTIAGSLTDGNGNTPNEVEWTQITTSGTKIAEIEINGTSTDVYAPTGGGGGASALTDLTDVSISTPTNNQVLKYNSTTQKWENGTGGGGGGTSDYEELTNQPQVNGITLLGNKTTEDLNIIVEVTQAEYDALPETKLTDNVDYRITDAEVERVLTQAEYDALPNTKLTDGVNYFITDGSSGIVYSTTERKIGRWVDGSDIYQKTWVGTGTFTAPLIIDGSFTPTTRQIVAEFPVIETDVEVAETFDATISGVRYVARALQNVSGLQINISGLTVKRYALTLQYIKLD